jgi:tetratricopeptide (TPR) repeat protein
MPLAAEVTCGESVQALFQKGHYRAFLAEYDRHRASGAELPPSLALLSAKALSRMGRPEESLARIAPLVDPASSGPQIAVRALLQRAVLEIVYGNADDAEATFEEAARIVTSSRDAELEFQLHLHQAMRAWAQRDLAATEALARSAMSSMNPETLALAAQFLGFIAASRGRYMEQIAILESALAEIDRAPRRDVWIEISILQNISGIVCDMYLPAVARRMADRAEAIEWTDELTVQQYHILRSLAYFRSLGSDPFLPFEYLDQASTIAPTEPWKLVSRLDRVFLIQEMSGDRIVKDCDVAAEIASAQQVAAEIDWGATHGEDRYGLLILAELLCKSHPREAATQLALYRSSQQSMSPLLMGRSDARWTATENFVEGTVAAANGEKERGTALIADAFAFYSDVGYSWRATRAAIKLYELTGEERHIEWASRESRRYPYSWLSDAVSRAGHLRR